MSKVSRRISVY